MCVDDENAISKKPPLLIAQDTHNAQSTQHKLGVEFSYLERNDSSLLAIKLRWWLLGAARTQLDLSQFVWYRKK